LAYYFTLYWLIQLVCAVTLGAGRQLVLAPILGDLPARAVGTFVLCLVIVCLARRFTRRHRPSPAARLGVGFLWCALTLAFEFLAGHYLFGASWEVLWADWNMAQGHLWPLVPAVTLLAPLPAPPASRAAAARP
jgi:glycerol uptake facilitator-like aquaporin